MSHSEIIFYDTFIGQAMWSLPLLSVSNLFSLIL